MLQIKEILLKLFVNRHSFVGSVVKWLKRRPYDRHSLGSKPTRAILLCPWERHFTALSPASGLGKQF